jgi:hypothetical protein
MPPSGVSKKQKTLTVKFLRTGKNFRGPAADKHFSTDQHSISLRTISVSHKAYE